MKVEEKPNSDATIGHKKCRVSAERFVSVVLANDLSENPKYNYQLAKELGIGREWFYDLLHKYEPELAEARSLVQVQIYRDAVRMLRKRLRGKFDLGVMAFAFGIAGVPFAQSVNQPGGITQNFYKMEIGELEQYVHNRLQETRRKNSTKPGRKN